MTTHAFSVDIVQTVLQVLDPHAPDAGGNAWSQSALAQGFSARPQSAAFEITEDTCTLPVEVRVQDARPDTAGAARAIVVPFEVVAPGQVEVGNIYAAAGANAIAIAPGRYALTFELALDAAADAAAWREESVSHRDRDEPGPPMRCTLTFSRETVNAPAILRNEAEPRLAPTGPLVMDATLA